jgi:polar amino acid transport system permease protein
MSPASQLLDNFFNLDVLARYLPSLLTGFGVTVEVAVVVVIAGIAFGFALALLRCAQQPVLDALITVYVDVFRTLPQLVIVIFVYFALPYAGISLSPFAATVLSLALVLSAFSAEILWAAIRALPQGQWDACRALGLRTGQLLAYVIEPQAVRIAIPMLANRSIAISKGTALGAAISLPEVLGTAQSAAQMSANPSPLTLAAVLYLILFIPAVLASRVLESRYRWTR